MFVANISCGANICLFYFKTKFHVLIDVNKRKKRPTMAADHHRTCVEVHPTWN